MTTAYKVLKRITFSEFKHSRCRQRISSSTRDPMFRTVYPVQTWLDIPRGMSFVFIDEQAAWEFKEAHASPHNPLELWQVEAGHEPKQLLGMADRWSNIPLFWDAYDNDDILGLSRVVVPCPPTYFGLRRLRLHHRLD